MNRKITVALGLVGLIALPLLAAQAASLWPNFPIVGGASFCASNTTAGVPGTTANCINTVPAGPTTYTGKEQVRAALSTGGAGNGGAASDVIIPGPVFGVGARSIITSPAAATIPADTPIYILNGTQGSLFTLTMPAAPLDGYQQRVVCTAATTGALVVAANAGQTVKGNPNTACVASTGYGWLYNAADTTWYRFQ